MKKQKKLTFSSILAAFLLTLFAISAAVVITLNLRPLYQWEIRRQELPEKVGMSESEILRNYDALIEYNCIFFTGELELPGFSMSDNGRIHFREVKQIFSVVQLLLAVTLVGGILLAWLRLRKWDPSFLLLGGVFALGLPAVLGLLIALCWEQVFIGFHRLFFNNDFWLFNAVDDPVITILPDSFFLLCALLILILVLLAGVVQLLLYSRLRQKPIKKYKSRYTLNI